MSNAVAGRHGARGLGMAGYVLRRNGVPMGAKGGLRNMFARSLGASSFAGFWRYWNPIFGYALGRYVYRPARQFLPRGIALVVTFIVCGAVHDLVTMAVRGSFAFLFTPWFFFLGSGVILGEALRLEVNSARWPVRAAANLSYLAACLGLALWVKQAVNV